MGSETGAKWFLGILFYFIIIIFLITSIENVTDTTIGNINEHYSDYCSLPRTTYELYPDEIIISDTESEGYTANFWTGNIECKFSKGILSQTYCEEIDGCSWEASSFLWWEVGEPTCVGTFNATTYGFNESDIQSWLFEGSVIEYDVDEFLDSNDICAYPSVVENETLCNMLSCSWIPYEKDVTSINVNDVKPSVSFVSNTWKIVSEVFTFEFDFGFENETINNLLIFITFILPLIGLGLSFYVMIRS